jgi:hypothetical protein
MKTLKRHLLKLLVGAVVGAAVGALVGWLLMGRGWSYTRYWGRVSWRPSPPCTIPTSSTLARTAGGRPPRTIAAFPRTNVAISASWRVRQPYPPQGEGKMARSAASKVAWVGRTASMVFVLAGCSGTGSAGTQGERAKATSAAPPEAEDDNATTVEGREVRVEMVANDSGDSLEIDRMKPGQAQGDIICEASADINRVESCAYTPVKGFTGEDQFSYVVKDASGRTDSATVYVKVKPVD